MKKKTWFLSHFWARIVIFIPFSNVQKTPQHCNDRFVVSKSKSRIGHREVVQHQSTELKILFIFLKLLINSFLKRISKVDLNSGPNHKNPMCLCYGASGQLQIILKYYEARPMHFKAHQMRPSTSFAVEVNWIKFMEYKK